MGTTSQCEDVWKFTCKVTVITQHGEKHQKLVLMNSLHFTSLHLKLNQLAQIFGARRSGHYPRGPTQTIHVECAHFQKAVCLSSWRCWIVPRADEEE